MVREARLSDLDCLVDLGVGMVEYHVMFDECFAPGPMVQAAYRRLFRSSMRSKSRLLLVADCRGVPVGYALAELRRKPPVFKSRRYGAISDMFVAAKYRRRGIGKKFMRVMKGWFRKKGITRIELTVHSKNKIGLRAWESFGFEDHMRKMKARI